MILNPRILFGLCFALLAALPLYADPQQKTQTAPMPTYGPWHSCRIGGGGYLQNVVLCPSNPKVAYTYVDVGGAYRSEDGGRHWRMLHGGLPARAGCYEVRGLLVDPRSDKNVLVAAGSQWTDPEGIYASADGGRTWRQTLKAPFFGNGPLREAGVILARQPGSPNIVLAASVNAGVFRSTDNGQTWAPCGAEKLYPTSLLFDQMDPKRVWLCASALTTWYSGSNQNWPSAFLKSEDGGKTWNKASDASPMEIVQDADGRLVGIFDYSALRESRDGGHTWVDASQGLPLDSKVTTDYSSNTHTSAITVGPGFLVLATAHGIFYKRQSGQTQWTKIAEAGPSSAAGDWWGAYQPNQWSHVGAAVGSIIVDPHDDAHWFFTDWFAMYQSYTSGQQWTLTIDGIESTVIHTFAQDPANPKIVYLGMADNGYFKSTDGGATFRQITEGISNNIKDISASRADPNRLYAVGPQGSGWFANQVFLSVDAGQKWEASPMAGLPDRSQAKCNSIAADLRDPQTVYVAVSGTVGTGKGGPYKSVDGGKTWAWIGEGLSGSFFRSQIFGGVGREIAVGIDNSLVAVSHDNWQIWRRGAGDAQWTQSKLKVDGQPNCLIADPLQAGRFYVTLTGSGLYRTDDSGKTWILVYKGSTAYIAVDAAVPGRIAVSTEDAILLSTNNGATWVKLDSQLPARVNCPLSFAGERLLVGSSGSGAFWIALPSAKVPALSPTLTPTRKRRENA